MGRIGSDVDIGNAEICLVTANSSKFQTDSVHYLNSG